MSDQIADMAASLQPSPHDHWTDSGWGKQGYTHAHYGGQKPHNHDATPPENPESRENLDRVKFHACLHCGWRGRGYRVVFAAPVCPECGQPVWEETVGITRAADDAGDDTSASACQRCGKPGDFRMGDFHHIWAQDEWDCVASDGPGADAGEVPATRHNRARDPAVRSSDDVGEEHGICRLECQHEGACWDGDRVWLREGVTFRPSEDSATPSASADITNADMLRASHRLLDSEKYALKRMDELGDRPQAAALAIVELVVEGLGLAVVADGDAT